MTGTANAEPTAYKQHDVEGEYHPIDIEKRILFVFVEHCFEIE